MYMGRWFLVIPFLEILFLVGRSMRRQGHFLEPSMGQSLAQVGFLRWNGLHPTGEVVSLEAEMMLMETGRIYLPFSPLVPPLDTLLAHQIVEFLLMP